MLANSGQWQPVERILSSEKARDAKKPLLSAEASWLIRDILAKNPAPNRLQLAGQAKATYSVSWKTGTSWAHRDAWAAGIVGPYVLMVWAGNFNGEGNPFLVGRKAAAPLFFEIADALANGKNADQFALLGEPPHKLNLSKVEVCSATGDLPNPACPSSENAWFIPGISPIKMSSIHQQIPVYADTEGNKAGKRACLHNPPHTELKTFELWPSHIQRLYRNSGIGRKTPPPFAEACANELLAGNSPTIVSPDNAVSYSLSGRNKAIPLIANAAADATTLYWFVNDRFVGESKPSSSLLWLGYNGVHNVAVTDQLGRSNETLLRVTD
jgi:penicillin-binding protein 1C